MVKAVIQLLLIKKWIETKTGPQLIMIDDPTLFLDCKRLFQGKVMLKAPLFLKQIHHAYLKARQLKGVYAFILKTIKIRLMINAKPLIKAPIAEFLYCFLLLPCLSYPFSIIPEY